MKPFPLPVEDRRDAVGLSTGNARAILNEVLHALKQLRDNGETQTIDLRAMPMAPGDLAKIELFLGEGELTATLNALGRSEIRESRYPGVWLITHRNDSEDVIGRFIEITECPEILTTQSEDLAAGLADFRDRLTDEEFSF